MMVCFFSTFPVACTMHIFNHNMAGLMINPVYGLISQQPAPMKMCQATRYPWISLMNIQFTFEYLLRTCFTEEYIDCLQYIFTHNL